MAKTIFIAHPISGDVEENIKKVLSICRVIHSQRIIPIFPSLVWRQYLPQNEETKKLAAQVNEEYFKRGMVDEVWFYGTMLSDGMRCEALLALNYNIPIKAMSKQMKKALSRALA